MPFSFYSSPHHLDHSLHKKFRIGADEEAGQVTSNFKQKNISIASLKTLEYRVIQTRYIHLLFNDVQQKSLEYTCHGSRMTHRLTNCPTFIGSIREGRLDRTDILVRFLRVNDLVRVEIREKNHHQNLHRENHRTISLFWQQNFRCRLLNQNLLYEK